MTDLVLRRVSSWNPAFVASLKQHYSGSQGPPPGKKMVWEVLELGSRRGWVGLGEPSFKLAPRRALGLTDARPLDRTVSCFVYRLEREGAIRASDILKVWHEVAAYDWWRRYGWSPVHWETMVDATKVQSEVPGACFRRAGYRSLGLTTGRSARRPAGHARGPRVWCDATPKLVFYRGPLARVPTAEG